MISVSVKDFSDVRILNIMVTGSVMRVCALTSVINVNVMAPGFFKSKMTAVLFDTEEKEKEIMERAAMNRAGNLEDAAGLVIYFSSKAGAFVTGETIACDGGSVNTT